VKVAVVGAGSLGSLLAWQLAAADPAADITVAVRRPGHAEALRRDGITLLDPASRSLGTVFVDAITVEEAAEVHEAVFVTTKAYDVCGAVRSFRSLVGPATPVVCLQNGLGIADDVRSVLGSDHVPPVVRALTNNGATRVSDNVVRMGGQGETHVGPAFGGAGCEHAIRDTGAILQAAGWETHLVSDITPFLWGKLLVNAGINPITALLGQPNGVLLDNPEAARACRLVTTEAARVARALGVELPWPDPVEETARVAGYTAKNRSSMLQDLDAGHRTEIDYINGAVIRYGAKVGVDTPFNRLLAMLVRAREIGFPEEGSSR